MIPRNTLISIYEIQQSIATTSIVVDENNILADTFKARKVSVMKLKVILAMKVNFKKVMKTVKQKAMIMIVLRK